MNRRKIRLNLFFDTFLIIVLLVTTPLPLAAQYKVPLPKSQSKTLSFFDPPHYGNGMHCPSCHILHQKPDAQLNTLAGNANLCMSCHHPAGLAGTMPFTEASRAIPGVSGNSHAWATPARNEKHGAQPPGNPQMANKLINGHVVCTTCHDPHDQTFPPYLRAANQQDALCKDCHAVRNAGSFRTDPNNKGSHPVGLAYPKDDARFYNTPRDPKLALVDSARVECTTCHNVHAADSGGANGGAGDGYILRVANDDGLCQACHTYGQHNGQGCRQCHRPHDPARTNIFLLRDSVTTPQGDVKKVIFTAETGPSSFADGDDKYDGICEVCHTATAYHRNNKTGNHLHMAGTNCTSCHTHQNGFRAPAMACTDCHNSPQDNGDGIPPDGRRAVAAEFQQKSHHLQSTSLDKNDCRVCHEMSQHTQGRLRLLDRNDSQTVYELINRPMSDPAEAQKLAPFCLNCHDRDGDRPFSDGKTPPSIDADDWNASSHKLKGATCMGDGETFGCHANGHASGKRQLLAPADASQPPVPGDPRREEEGMCYSCHDNNGPATSDIAAQFNLPSRHHVSALDQQNGAKVECTNCHNPHFASSANRLANPDDGATTPWRGKKADFCLTCHDGNAPTGVAFPSQSPGSGYDKSAFVGTSHYSNMIGAGCVHCHQPHGSSYISLLKGNYKINDSGNYQGQDFQACWLCHRENALFNENNDVTELHEEHVKEKGIPCVACHDVHNPQDRGEPGLISFALAMKKGFNLRFIDGRNASTAFWIDSQKNEGYCYLVCHGEEHKPEHYQRARMSTTQCSPCH